MKVIAIEKLFGNNDFICSCEEYAMSKDGIKYLPLQIVEKSGFCYLPTWVQEVDFE